MSYVYQIHDALSQGKLQVQAQLDKFTAQAQAARTLQEQATAEISQALQAAFAAHPDSALWPHGPLRTAVETAVRHAQDHYDHLADDTQPWDHATREQAQIDLQALQGKARVSDTAADEARDRLRSHPLNHFLASSRANMATTSPNLRQLQELLPKPSRWSRAYWQADSVKRQQWRLIGAYESATKRAFDKDLAGLNALLGQATTHTTEAKALQNQAVALAQEMEAKDHRRAAFVQLGERPAYLQGSALEHLRRASAPEQRDWLAVVSPLHLKDVIFAQTRIIGAERLVHNLEQGKSAMEKLGSQLSGQLTKVDRAMRHGARRKHVPLDAAHLTTQITTAIARLAPLEQSSLAALDRLPALAGATSDTQAKFYQRAEQASDPTQWLLMWWLLDGGTAEPALAMGLAGLSSQWELLLDAARSPSDHPRISVPTADLDGWVNDGTLGATLAAGIDGSTTFAAGLPSLDVPSFDMALPDVSLPSLDSTLPSFEPSSLDSSIHTSIDFGSSIDSGSSFDSSSW